MKGIKPMKSMGQVVAFAAVFAVAACGSETTAEADRAETYTLYRNSPLDRGERVHWATFNADDKGDYNRGNCAMAARLLNANVGESAIAEGKEPYSGVGFWCEPGKYAEQGSTPSEFDSSFPATSDSPLSW